MSRRDSMSRFISLSSTIRILAMRHSSTLGSDFRRLGQTDQYPPQHLGEIIGTLGDDLARASGQQFALGRTQRHRRQNDDRDSAPLGMFLDLFEKGEAVHARHQEIE